MEETEVATKYISVCKNTVLRNLKRGTSDPPIRVSRGKYGKPTYFHLYHITQPARVIYDMERPMPWGARVWIEEEEESDRAQHPVS